MLEQKWLSWALQAVLEKDGRDYSKAFAPSADGGGVGRAAGGGLAKKRRI